MFVAALRQCMHSSHCGENSVTTWSPGRQRAHALADATRPRRRPHGRAPRGVARRIVPEAEYMSVWQMPHARRRTSTSLGPARRGRPPAPRAAPRNAPAPPREPSCEVALRMKRSRGFGAGAAVAQGEGLGLEAARSLGGGPRIGGCRWRPTSYARPVRLRDLKGEAWARFGRVYLILRHALSATLIERRLGIDTSDYGELDALGIDPPRRDRYLASNWLDLQDSPRARY